MASGADRLNKGDAHKENFTMAQYFELVERSS